MNLSQAIHFGPYPGAVSCQYRWYPAPGNCNYRVVYRRILAHVCRQGGYKAHEWWTVSYDWIERERVPAHFQSEYGETWLVPRHDLNMIASFKDINGCYRWLGEHRIDAFNGWYPTKNEKGWDRLGSQ